MTLSPGWTQRVVASRQRIGDQAIALFLERGFDQVTIAEIAAAAEVGERTVYRHFATKEAFVFGSAPGTFDRLLGAISRAPADLAPTEVVIDALRRGASRRTDLEDERKRMTLLRRHPALQQAWLVELHHFEAGLARWLVARSSRPEDDLACRMAAAAIVAAHRIATERWTGTDMASYLEDFIAGISVFADRIDALTT